PDDGADDGADAVRPVGAGAGGELLRGGPRWAHSSRLQSESEFGHRSEHLAWSQDRVRKRRLVGRVRIMLRLETETGPCRVAGPALAGDRIIERIACVELHGRLRRVHLEGPPRVALMHARGALEPVAHAIDHEVVVVAATQ